MLTLCVLSWPRWAAELLVSELAGVGAGVVGYDLALAVELPFVDEEAAFGFMISEL
jgi:CHASE2 domain-containing sensor protein